MTSHQKLRNLHQLPILIHAGDGRGTLGHEDLAAAQFIDVVDPNVRAPGDPGEQNQLIIVAGGAL